MKISFCFFRFNLKKKYSLGLLAALGIAQLAFFDNFRVFNLKPDLLLAGVIILNLFFEWRWMFFLSLFAGVFKDVFSVSTPFLNSILFPLWSFLIIRLSRQVSLDNTPIRLALIFSVAFLHNIISGLSRVYLGDLIPLGIFLRILFLGSFYTVFMGWFLLRSIRKVGDRA